MTQISAEQIKQLRESTGAGMLDCRKALTENNGNMEAAVDWLRTKGLSAAAKKSGRVAAEGVCAVAVEGTKGALIELNAETDFVARNEQFQQLAGGIAEFALRHSTDDVEALKQAKCPKTGKSIAEQITNAVATIGENMNLRRVALLGVHNGVVASYVHSAVATGMGKIGVLIALESEGDAGKLQTLGKQIAMHIAASNPTYLKKDQVSSQELTREENATGEQTEKFLEQFLAFEAAIVKYKDKLSQERSFSEKMLESKLVELNQTLRSVDELLGDYDRQSKSEDRKEKQNADKTKKILEVFFQETAYMLKKIRSYGDNNAIKQKLKQLKIERFFEDNVLEEQIFVMDNKNKISQVIANAEKEIGKPVKVTGFIRFQLGEGIEKATSDFAAEVKAAANG